MGDDEQVIHIVVDFSDRCTSRSPRFYDVGMPLTDLGIDEARTYRPNVPEPDGFDYFWAETLDEYSGVPQDLTAVPFDNRQALIDTWDLSWAGYHNSRVSG